MPRAHTISTLLKRLTGLLFAAVFFQGGPSPALAQTADPEIRGVWVDTWGAGFRNATEIDQLIADAQRANLNAIFPQVRRRGDAFYNNALEPKNASVSPSGFDPLAYLIQRARAANPPIEVHAWIVVYPIWNNQNTPPASPNHVYNKHPEWLTQSNTGALWDGSNYQLDPGHPEVQRHTLDVAMDIISRYEVDGFHLDYIRYNGRNWGYNEVAVERFNSRFGRTGQPSPTDSAWMRFRRDQVTDLVRKIYLNAIDLKPDVNVSAATIAWAPGITSTGQFNNSSAYASVFQDWRGWMEEGIIDLNIPMMYFNHSERPNDWNNWNTFVKNHRYNRHAAAGAGWYMNSVANSITQLRSTRTPTSAGNRTDGAVGFSYRVTNNQGIGRTTFLNALSSPSAHDGVTPPIYAQPAPLPAMPWKTNPTRGHLKGHITEAGTGRVLDGLTATLSGPQNRSLRSGATGFHGAVDLPPGTYQFTVNASGYATFQQSVQITAGQVATLDAALERELASEIIIEHGDAVFQGSWTLTENPQQYGSNYRLAWPTDGAPTSTAVYQPNISIAGTYDIDIWYVSGANRSPDVPYTLVDREGSATTLHDQRTGGGQWVRLASERPFNTGTGGHLLITNSASCCVVTADAVRFTLVEADPDPDLFFSDMVVLPGTDRARIRFTTAEPALVEVFYGENGNPNQSTGQSTEPRTEHTVVVTGLGEDRLISYKIAATDTSDFTRESSVRSFQTAASVYVDNRGASFTGTWNTGTFPTPFGPDYNWISTVTGNPTHTATFRPDLPAAGVYNISVWYVQGTNRTTDARHQIHHPDGVTTVSINQRSGGSQWRPLAQEVFLEAGDAAFVRIINQSSAGGDALMADGIRFSLVEPLLTHPVETTTVGEGIVQRDPDAVEIADGESITLTAEPTEGWVFTGWNGDSEGTENPLILTVNRPLAVTAQFVPLVRLTTVVTGPGSVSVDPSLDEFASGETATLTAHPEEGYIFLGWNGDLEENENPASLLLDTDKTVFALFGRTYASWLATVFTEEERGDPAVSGPLADPFGTGLPNLLRHAFGIGLKETGAEHLPRLVTGGNLPEFKYRRSRHAADLVFELEVSENLISWESAGELFEEISAEPDQNGETETVVLRAAAPVDGRTLFLRVRVIANGG